MLWKPLWTLAVLVLVSTIIGKSPSIFEKPQAQETTEQVISDPVIIGRNDQSGASELSIFKSDDIDDELYAFMLGKSYKENDYIQIEDLKVLTVTYYGFDDESHLGQLVVNKAVASEVLSIFEALYTEKYPIDKINLVDYYDADDDLSMADNNTSGFNFRVVSGSTNLSNHSFGLAIDINPLQNPYVTSKGVFPPEGRDFVDRNQKEKGMILEGDLCYTLFKENGWAWGGDYKSVKDYQHFEKKLLTE